MIKYVPGWVTKFLSLPIFVPLGRLSYCIYLVHMAVQGISIASPESTATFLNSDSVCFSFCDECCSHSVHAKDFN